MPHLNSCPFTEERLGSILAQTLEDWELIIVDSGSDDGSLKILESYAASDRRIRLIQAPRDGIYSNLNRAIQQARGDFVYIATSDDTMTPDCLELMTVALEKTPECGMCHCCLEIIDENGVPVVGNSAWEHWAKNIFGEWIYVTHIRRAPHDGLLHFYSGTVYTSLTQLLIRRRVFQELGLFRTDCGSYADFEWGMRVALNENVIHVPEKLASWRQHDRQATQSDAKLRTSARGEFRRLTKVALRSLRSRDPRLALALKKSALNRYYLVDELIARQRATTQTFGKIRARIVFSLVHPIFTIKWLYTKLILRRRVIEKLPGVFENELVRLGYGNLLQRVDYSYANVH